MALDGFAKLAPDILLYTPPDAAVGQLVILGTWMGAADKYIAKYIELHKKQLPMASILLLKSGVSSMVSPYKKQQVAIEPAMALILGLLEQCKESNTKPRILLHMFSNGGINSATHVLIDLNHKRKAPLPLIGLICDSVPTGAGYWKTYNAFMYSFPQRFPTNIAAAMMVHTLLTLLFLSVAMGRYENPEDFWRKAILDKSLIDSNRIAYVASKADKQTDWRDVVAHAEVARKQGWDVKEIILEDTPHCNHLKKDPQMYYDLVTRVWEGHKL
ncbi:Nn.00g112070.m01.CDS01 [Neocucurbitaria sp. VM-36]